MLETAGLDLSDVIPHDVTQSHGVQRLSVLRISHRDLLIPPGDRAGFAALAARVLGPATPRPGRRVFLSRHSRSLAGGYRSLVNEPELMQAMTDLGFEIVEPETLPFPDQIRLFRETEVLVGLGGAGMFNAVFCQPGTRLVTLESGLTFVDAHCNIFASMGLDYGVVIGEEDPTDPRPSQKRWKLDLDKAVPAIAAFAGAQAKPRPRRRT